MSITTIHPPAREKSLSRLVEDVYSCLCRQPMVPLDLRVIANSIAGATVVDVETALATLEGPVAQAGNEAYIHHCRLNNQAVFIP